MSGASFALILTGVMLNAVAQLMLKAGTNRVGALELSYQSLSVLPSLALSAPILTGLSCYAVSVVVWIVALSRVEVSVAYPMLSIGYIVNAIAAWMLFGETLNPMKLAAIAVISVGVCMLAWSGRGA
ncbi:MAG: 4-amino-4-deoxy-L-arabinose transferase [Betaproteobacteria bacterium]|nr:4-amino-4-deoxy-L-arabinose transferase [Betaproteobacteria bacterium]